MKKVNFNYSRFIWQGFMGVALCVGSPSPLFATGVSVAETNNVQQTTVRGTVVDASGEPMIGVTVAVKGSTAGTVTGLDGSFSLNCKPTDVLVFSYVGFVSQEVRANANLSRIVLKEDNSILEEVVVIGYGTTTRKSAVGAVDQVRSDLLENRPVANVTQALQGAAPNVIIQRKDYNPNSQNNNFNIRGISTLNDNRFGSSEAFNFSRPEPNILKALSFNFKTPRDDIAKGTGAFHHSGNCGASGSKASSRLPTKEPVFLTYKADESSSSKLSSFSISRGLKIFLSANCGRRLIIASAQFLSTIEINWPLLTTTAFPVSGM